MRNMLSDYKKRENLINQIIQVCQKYNLDGVNIDMENINQADKEYFSRLIIELKPRLESKGMKLSVDVTAPDGSPNWSLCYDRKTIGDVADYIIFMAYDQTSKNGSRIGSNAAANWVETNINKFIKNNEVDSRKLIIAIPFYSRMWKVNADGTSAGSFDINMNKQDKYLQKATKKEWNEDAKQNYMEYQENGFTYKMWVEDEKSVSAKLDLVKKYDLGGAAFWEKGCEIEAVWDVVEKKMF
jgi:spore germination protein YaaH